MSGASNDTSAAVRQRGKFQNTLWEQVFAAAKQASPDSQEAMGKLYETYWPPIYSYLRRSGHNSQKAKDLAQDFFGYLWQQNLAAKADPARGRFRNFLIGVLRMYVKRSWQQEKVIKGGPNCHVVSIDAEIELGVYGTEPVTHETPETLFERQWALKVLEQAMRRLETEYTEAGLAEAFNLLKACLTGDNEERHAALAKKLGKSEGATRTEVCRLRARQRELILEVISDTLANKEEAEDEFAHLVAILRTHK